MRNEQRPLRWYDYAGILGVLLVLISGIGFLYSAVPALLHSLTNFPLLTMLVFGMILIVLCGVVTDLEDRR